jgi:hypothetical protein
MFVYGITQLKPINVLYVNECPIVIAHFNCSHAKERMTNVHKLVAYMYLTE